MEVEMPQALMLPSCGEPVSSDADNKGNVFFPITLQCSSFWSSSSSSTRPSFSSRLREEENHSQSCDYFPPCRLYHSASTAEIIDTTITDATIASVTGPSRPTLSSFCISRVITDNNNNISHPQRWHRQLFLARNTSEEQ